MQPFVSYFTNLTWPKLAKITWILMAVFIIFVFSVCLFKYYTYTYNSIDLAIFNQVFFNSVNGHLFSFTIHPTSYLGDHFEIIILLLLPFYNLFKSPLTLLLIQAIFTALCAIPLYFLAKKYLTPLLGLLVICLFLFNPATLNFIFFEFHILPLAMFFILWAFYFYDQNKFLPFLSFMILSLLVREDVALVVFMFGILALIDRKKLRFILTPLLMSPIYFWLALKIVSYFSTGKNYKFLIYYGWLGHSVKDIALNFFLKFPEVLSHIFLNPTHLQLILGLLLLMLFLPLYRPKYLLLALPALGEFILGRNSGYLILQTHYVTLFLPALMIATIFSLRALSQNYKVIQFNRDYKGAIPLILIISLIFLIWQLTPLTAIATIPWQTDYGQVGLKNDFTKLIPDQAIALTGFATLPQLSSRPQLYYFWYAYLNQQQYKAGPYDLPANLQYILLDFDDFKILYLDKGRSADYPVGSARLRQLLPQYTLVKADQNLALWQKNVPDQNLRLYQIFSQEPKISHKKNPALKQDSAIEFLGYDQSDKLTSLYFRCLKAMDKNYFIQINNHDYPLGYGIYPNTDWQVNQIIRLNFYGLDNFSSFKIVNLEGSLGLDKINSYTPTILKTEVINSEKLD